MQSSSRLSILSNMSAFLHCVPDATIDGTGTKTTPRVAHRPGVRQIRKEKVTVQHTKP